jgi:Mce-associated membrane protein
MNPDSTRTRLVELRARFSWPLGAALVVTIGLLAFAGQRALAWHDEQQRAIDAKDATAAAAAEVEGLIDVSSRTLDANIATLLDGATADFRSELESQTDRLRKELNDKAVIATGEVVSAGVVKLDHGRATVIVAATGTVKNEQTTDADPRNYRLRVDLRQDGDRWLVSGLEFVA